MSKIISAALVAAALGLATLTSATAAEQLDCKLKVTCSLSGSCTFHAKGLCPTVSS